MQRLEWNFHIFWTVKGDYNDSVCVGGWMSVWLGCVCVCVGYQVEAVR